MNKRGTEFGLATCAPQSPITIVISGTPTAPPSILRLEGDARAINGLIGIAFDANENTLVVDAGNAQVVKFDATGDPVMAFGSETRGDRQFSFLSENTGYLALDRMEAVMLPTPLTHRFTSSMQTGHFFGTGSSRKILSNSRRDF